MSRCRVCCRILDRLAFWHWRCQQVFHNRAVVRWRVDDDRRCFILAGLPELAPAQAAPIPGSRLLQLLPIPLARLLPDRDRSYLYRHPAARSDWQLDRLSCLYRARASTFGFDPSFGRAAVDRTWTATDQF